MRSTLPPKVNAAFEYLDHVRILTDQSDASIPARSLSVLEKSVEVAALRTVQMYLLGEMEFAEGAGSAPQPRKEDDGESPQKVGSAR